MRRTLAAVAPLAVGMTMLLGVACGDGGPPDAAKVYRDVGEKMAALTSYHATVEGLEQGEPFRFEGDFAPPDRLQVTFTGTEDGESVEFSVIAIGDQSYFSPPDSPDYFIAPQEGFEDFGYIAAFFTALTTEISDLTYLNEETVDGVATHHLRGTLAPEVLALVDSESPPSGSAPIEVWVGRDDSLVRRYVLALSDPEEESTAALSRFDDEAINIVAPANPRPAEELEEQFEEQPFLTPEVLQEAIASLSAEERDCLRRVLGDAAFAEFEAGTRLPTEEQQHEGDECFTD